MSVTVTMPALGESVTEGTVTRWLKAVGDTVVADEPLLEVSTDKVDTEIPAPASGVLVSIAVGEDETVEVGAELAVIGEASESAAAEPAASAPEPAAPAAADPAPVVEPPAPPAAEVAAPPAATPPAPAAAGGDSTAVLMPALGESVTEGTVTRWLKAVGDTVAADEPLLEVSTDKVDTEIPSPAAGVLMSIAVGEDETVEVGAELGRIGASSSVGTRRAAAPAPAAPAPAAPAAPAAPTTSAPAAPAPSSPATSSGPAANTDAYVTPLVRRLAAQHDVDLSTVTGTGIGGRVRKSDVLEAAMKKNEAAAASTASATATAPAATPAPKAPAAAVAESPLARTNREADPAAQGDRRAHGRVPAGLGPADDCGRGRRDPHRQPPREGQA